jgi:hypothetical protein
MADAFTARRFAKSDSFWFGWINGRFPDSTDDDRARAMRAANVAVGAGSGVAGVGELLAAARRLRKAAV